MTAPHSDPFLIGFSVGSDAPQQMTRNADEPDVRFTKSIVNNNLQFVLSKKLYNTHLALRPTRHAERAQLQNRGLMQFAFAHIRSVRMT